MDERIERISYLEEQIKAVRNSLCSLSARISCATGDRRRQAIEKVKRMEVVEEQMNAELKELTGGTEGPRATIFACRPI